MTLSIYGYSLSCHSCAFNLNVPRTRPSWESGQQENGLSVRAVWSFPVAPRWRIRAPATRCFEAIHVGRHPSGGKMRSEVRPVLWEGRVWREHSVPMRNFRRKAPTLARGSNSIKERHGHAPRRRFIDNKRPMFPVGGLNLRCDTRGGLRCFPV